MNKNPYAAPSSDLGKELTTEIKRSILWKIYFFIISLLSVLGLVSASFDEHAGVPEIISIILFIPAITGMFGYIFSKKILNRYVWHYVLVVSVLWGFVYYFVTSIDLRMGLDATSYYISQTISWVVSLPFYISIYLYGRKKYPLWQK